MIGACLHFLDILSGGVSPIENEGDIFAFGSQLLASVDERLGKV
jgi:hypothetical protein